MSIRRENYGEQQMPKWERNVTFVCDECGGLLETMTSSFGEALEEFRENNWLSRQDNRNRKWHHYCENCRHPGKVNDKVND